MINQIIGEESVCICKNLLTMNIDVGDGFLHDVCVGGCGYKRKKTMDGSVVEEIELVETIRRAEARRKREGRELK